MGLSFLISILSIKDSLSIIKNMDLVYYYKTMGIYTKGNGLMVKNMELASFLTPKIIHFIKGSLKMVNSTALEL